LNQALAAISKGDLDLIFGPFGPTTAFWSEISKPKPAFPPELHVLPDVIVQMRHIFAGMAYGQKAQTS
jgi:hypothetical protein